MLEQICIALLGAAAAVLFEALLELAKDSWSKRAQR